MAPYTDEIARRVVRELFGDVPHTFTATYTHSIYSFLQALYEQCDSKSGNYEALAPSPELNLTLIRLVKRLCGDFGTLTERDESDFSGGRIKNALIAKAILSAIASSRELQRRSLKIKHIAELAEAEMEFAYCVEITRTLDSLSVEAFDRRVASSVGQDNFAGQPGNRHASNEAVRRFQLAFKAFPYTRNYEIMVSHEVSVLQTKGSERQMIRPHCHSSIQNASVVKKSSFKTTPAIKHDGSISIAFCGSGPLPLTAILLHIYTGRKLILVDWDLRAVHQSRHLIECLEKHNVVSKAALEVIHADATQILYGRPDRMHSQRVKASTGKLQIDCDVLVLASLLSTPAKVSIAKNARRYPSKAKTIIARSAAGLVSRLAYDEVPIEEFRASGWTFAGCLLPEREAILDSITTQKTESSCFDGRILLGTMDSEVLNTVEVYSRP